MGLSTLHDMIGGPAQDAGDAAAFAAEQKRKFLEQQWMELQGMQGPFINQGQQAFGLYGQFAGMQGPEAQQAALANFQMTPGAQFGLEQQLKGIGQNAAATGGIFGGNRLQQETAARTQGYQTDLGNYLERLRTQAGLGQQAAGALGGVGTISGQGIAGAIMGGGDAAANAALAGSQAQAGVASGVGSILGAVSAFSDARLKQNVVKIGKHGDLRVYQWEWNKLANDMGLTGTSVGHIAQEVQALYPDLVTQDGDYLKVIYGDGRTMDKTSGERVEPAITPEVLEASEEVTVEITAPAELPPIITEDEEI